MNHLLKVILSSIKNLFDEEGFIKKNETKRLEKIANSSLLTIIQLISVNRRHINFVINYLNQNIIPNVIK